MRAALYARVSSDRQAEKDLSIPAQLKALRKHAQDRDWDIVAEYVDEAESARSANRPRFKEMVAAAKRKDRAFDCILVWKLSRFARNREDSILYKSLLRKLGVQVVSINEPTDDSPVGKLLEGIIETIDEFFSSNLSQDTVRGMKENAARGFRNGGSTPFGYRSVRVKVGTAHRTCLEVEECEAAVVRRIFALASELKGGKDIARVLNADGLRTRIGKHFSASGVNNILRNEVYTGTLVWRADKRANGHKGEEAGAIRVAGAHPALISHKDFDRVQAMIAQRRPSVSHPRSVSSQYLLSGLLRCGKCGAAMVGASGKSGQFHYYHCNQRSKRGKEACDAPMIAKSKLEGFVLDRIRENILTEENLRQLVGLVNEELRRNSGAYERQLEDVRQQLASVKNKLARHYASVEEGKVDLDDLAPRIKELREQQRALERKQDEILDAMNGRDSQEVDLATVQRYVADLKELLGSASFLERKAFLRSFVEKVEFAPPRLAIEYTIPVGTGEGLTSRKEVLCIRGTGSPDWCLRACSETWSALP